MKKNIKYALLATCIISLQIIKPAMPLYAHTMALTYDGKQHTYNKPPITLTINNKQVAMTMPPVQIDERTLVPTREVFAAMGASVEWKDAEKKVFINHGDKLIVLGVDDPNAWVEGVSKKLDAPPKIINDKVMVPLRFIGESLGFKVDWEHETSHININQIMSAPDIKPPTINVPELKTTVEEVRVRNRSEDLSQYNIYLENPLETYHYFIHEGKIVVDIDGAKNSLGPTIRLEDNPFVQTVRTSQYSPETTRVVFDLTKEAISKAELSGDKKVITITVEAIKPGEVKPGPTVPDLVNPDLVNPGPVTPDPVIPEPVKPAPVPVEIQRDNFKYTNTPREAIVFKKVNGLLASDLIIKDDYRNKTITVTLPGNYSEVYYDGLITVASDTLDKILVKTNDKTQFVIHEKKIRAYEVIDDGENITIRFMDPRDKHSKIILLDLGHGGKDGGASGNGLTEKQLVMEQGMHLFNLLERDPNIKVYITREDDTYPSNPYRAQLANEIGADIFISLHNNSFTNPGPNGTEVLYSAKSAKSKQIAQIIQTNMVRQLGTFDRKIKERPNLIVLNQTNMPAVLVETAFVSNPGDAAKLKSPEFNRKVGQTIYDSIVEIFNTMSFR